MPILFKQNISPQGIIGVWAIEESLDYFNHKLKPTLEETNLLASMSERKAREWYASRYLLHLISGRSDRIQLSKTTSGKPFLMDSDWHISLSHSRDLVAVLASPELVGLDVQYFVDKITRIAPKFIHPTEYDHIDRRQEQLYYHFIWGAKESMFKLYGKGQVDFKQNLRIKAIQNDNGQLSGVGHIYKHDFNKEVRLVSNSFQDYILVYAI